MAITMRACSNLRTTDLRRGAHHFGDVVASMAIDATQQGIEKDVARPPIDDDQSFVFATESVTIEVDQVIRGGVAAREV